MSSETVLQEADAALRKAIDILYEKGSLGSGELSQDQALELVDAQQQLRNEYKELRIRIRSESTGWFRWSSSKPVTEHLKQCQDLIACIQETIEKNKGANLKSGRSSSGSTTAQPPTASRSTPGDMTSNVSSELRSSTSAGGNLGSTTSTNSESTQDDWENMTVPHNSRGVDASAVTDTTKTLLWDTPEAADPNTKAGGRKIYENFMILNGSNDIGTTMNVGGRHNSGSIINIDDRM
ncbi:hypothetical protein BU15DRAFT_64055 [Melanogaster broomeanus]|nr:hypothetical protein BU15DRAFT_64055 [Melanogaster broomeanus]